MNTNIPGFLTATEMPISGSWEAVCRKAIEYTDFPLPEIALPCRRLFWSDIQHPIALSSMYDASRPAGIETARNGLAEAGDREPLARGKL
jgi:hypothetical protein